MKTINICISSMTQTGHYFSAPTENIKEDATPRDYEVWTCGEDACHVRIRKGVASGHCPTFGHTEQGNMRRDTSHCSALGSPKRKETKDPEGGREGMRGESSGSRLEAGETWEGAGGA